MTDPEDRAADVLRQYRHAIGITVPEPLVLGRAIVAAIRAASPPDPLTIFGMPVVIDPTLPPGEVRIGNYRIILDKETT